MNPEVFRSKVLVSIVAYFVCGFVGTDALAGQTCAGTSPRVCVERADLSPPVLDTDVTFDTVTDPNNPDVTFQTGHNTIPWRVWSQASASDTMPGNLGDLAIESSGSDNFTVEIKNPNVCTPENDCNPGAINLGSAILTGTPGWMGFSLIGAGSKIMGNLNGDLVVVASGGSGGVVGLTIGGNAIGNISIPAMSGELTVGGNVLASSTITVADFVTPSFLSFNGNELVGTLEFAGNLNLQSGIPQGTTVDMFGRLTGSIDLNGLGIAELGYIKLRGGGSGSIVDGGTLAGEVWLAGEDIVAFSGMATFDSIQALTGAIRTEPGDISGSIFVTNDMAGSIGPDPGNLTSTSRIEIGGNLTGRLEAVSNSATTGSISGVIEIAGNASGSIAAERDLSATIHIGGDCSGELLAHADPTKAGNITGSILMDQVFSGNICGDNLPPLPSYVTYGELGCSATICENREDVTVSAAGCRYLSVTPPAGSEPVSLRVRTACDGPAASCPSRYVDANGDLLDLMADPFFQLPSVWGTKFITDEGIVPDRPYTVQISTMPDVLAFADSAQTPIWGDTSPDGGNGVVDIDDILCVLAVFTGTIDPPACTLESADLAPCVPNRIIDVDDILAALDAFSDGLYPYPEPCSSGSCPEESGGGFGPESIEAVIDTIAEEKNIEPDQSVVVWVYVTSTVDLRAFQAALEVSGGTSGTLNVEDIEIEDTWADYLFHNLSDVTAIDENTGRAVGALYSGDAAATTAKYLVSVTLRATSNAAGTFTVAARATDTLLRSEYGAAIGWEAGDIAEVFVDSG